MTLSASQDESTFSDSESVIDLTDGEENFEPSPPPKKKARTTKQAAKTATTPIASATTALMAAQLLALPDDFFAAQTKEQLLGSFTMVASYARQLQAAIATGVITTAATATTPKTPVAPSMDAETLAYEVIPSATPLCAKSKSQ